MRDHPSERRAASAPTKSRYAQNCSLFPKGNRSPASPAHLKKTTHPFSHLQTRDCQPRASQGAPPICTHSLHTLGSQDLIVGYGPIALRCNGSLSTRRPKRGLASRRAGSGSGQVGARRSFEAKFLSTILLEGRGYCCVFCCVYFNLTSHTCIVSLSRVLTTFVTTS